MNLGTELRITSLHWEEYINYIQSFKLEFIDDREVYTAWYKNTHEIHPFYYEYLLIGPHIEYCIGDSGLWDYFESLQSKVETMIKGFEKEWKSVDKISI